MKHSYFTCHHKVCITKIFSLLFNIDFLFLAPTKLRRQCDIVIKKYTALDRNTDKRRELKQNLFYKVSKTVQTPAFQIHFDSGSLIVPPMIRIKFSEITTRISKRTSQTAGEARITYFLASFWGEWKKLLLQLMKSSSLVSSTSDHPSDCFEIGLIGQRTLHLQ